MTSCSLAPLLPDSVNLCMELRGFLPAVVQLSETGRVKWLLNDELSFIDREVLPRLFAEILAILFLLNALGNALIGVGRALSIICAEDDGTSEAMQAFNNLSDAATNAFWGTAIFYAWLFPALIIEVAYATPEAEETPQTPEPMQQATPLAIDEPHDASPQGQFENPQSMLSSLLDETNAELAIIAIIHDDDGTSDTPTAQEELTENKEASQQEKDMSIIYPPEPPTNGVPLTLGFQVNLNLASAIPTGEKAKEMERVFVRMPSPTVPLSDPYLELTRTEEDRRVFEEARLAIEEMIQLLATSSAPDLLVKRKRLERLGAKAGSIHTLKYIECMFKTPQLAGHVKAMRDYSLMKMKIKWNSFLWGHNGKKGGLEGTAGALNQKANDGKLDAYLPGFAAALNVDLATVRKFAKDRDWEGLFNFLIAARAAS